MKQTHDAEQEPTGPQAGYLQLPAPLVALALVVFLGVLLALGLWANANLRPRGVIVPTAVAPTAVAASGAAAAATATPPVPVVLNSTPPATAQATQPAPQATAVATATPARTPLVIALDATATPVATEAATPLPTVEPALAAEVGKAYEKFWRVRSQAELTLDTSEAADVMYGPYLQHFIEVTTQLQDEHRAIKTQVVLNYTVVYVAGDVAYVHDRIEDNSVYVDPDTEAPTGEAQTSTVLIEFKLDNVGGTWKVVDSVVQD